MDLKKRHGDLTVVRLSSFFFFFFFFFEVSTRSITCHPPDRRHLHIGQSSFFPSFLVLFTSGLDFSSLLFLNRADRTMEPIPDDKLVKVSSDGTVQANLHEYIPTIIQLANELCTS